MSDKRFVRFKAIVAAKECQRQDSNYWIEIAPNDITFRLELVSEYYGEELCEDNLRKHGFKGACALQPPKCLNNDPDLMEYITSVF